MSRLAYLATALAHVKADDYAGVQRIRIMLSRVQRPNNCSHLMGQNEVAPQPCTYLVPLNRSESVQMSSSLVC